MPSRLRIAVTGLAATYPLGGVFWDYLQWALGFARLGHDLYVEDTGRCVNDAAAATFVESGEQNAGGPAECEQIGRHPRGSFDGPRGRWASAMPIRFR